MRNLADDPDLENVKKRLIEEMWNWASKTHDMIDVAYPPVALIPYGPR